MALDCYLPHKQGKRRKTIRSVQLDVQAGIEMPSDASHSQQTSRRSKTRGAFSGASDAREAGRCRSSRVLVGHTARGVEDKRYGCVTREAEVLRRLVCNSSRALCGSSTLGKLIMYIQPRMQMLKYMCPSNRHGPVSADVALCQHFEVQAWQPVDAKDPYLPMRWEHWHFLDTLVTKPIPAAFIVEAIRDQLGLVIPQMSWT